MYQGGGMEESSMMGIRSDDSVRVWCDHSMCYYGGASADIHAGLMRHGRWGYCSDYGGSIGVSYNGSSDCMGHDCRARDHIHAGLVRNGSWSDDGSTVSQVTQGTFLQPVSMTVTSKYWCSVGSVCEDWCGNSVAVDSGAGTYINTRLMRDGSRSDDGVSDRSYNRRDSSVHERSVVSFQYFSLKVESASVDDFRGVQRPAVGVQDDSGMMRGLRHRQKGAASHRGESEQHHHRFHNERGLCFLTMYVDHFKPHTAD